MINGTWSFGKIKAQLKDNDTLIFYNNGGVIDRAFGVDPIATADALDGLAREIHAECVGSEREVHASVYKLGESMGMHLYPYRNGQEWQFGEWSVALKDVVQFEFFKNVDHVDNMVVDSYDTAEETAVDLDELLEKIGQLPDMDEVARQEKISSMFWELVSPWDGVNLSFANE